MKPGKSICSGVHQRSLDSHPPPTRTHIQPSLSEEASLLPRIFEASFEYLGGVSPPLSGRVFFPPSTVPPHQDSAPLASTSTALLEPRGSPPSSKEDLCGDLAMSTHTNPSAGFKPSKETVDVLSYNNKPRRKYRSTNTHRDVRVNDESSSVASSINLGPPPGLERIHCGDRRGKGVAEAAPVDSVSFEDVCDRFESLGFSSLETLSKTPPSAAHIPFPVAPGRFSRRSQEGGGSSFSSSTHEGSSLGLQAFPPGLHPPSSHTPTRQSLNILRDCVDEGGVSNSRHAGFPKHSSSEDISRRNGDDLADEPGRGGHRDEGGFFTGQLFPPLHTHTQNSLAPPGLGGNPKEGRSKFEATRSSAKYSGKGRKDYNTHTTPSLGSLHCDDAGRDNMQAAAEGFGRMEACSSFPGYSNEESSLPHEKGSLGISRDEVNLGSKRDGRHGRHRGESQLFEQEHSNAHTQSSHTPNSHAHTSARMNPDNSRSTNPDAHSNTSPALDLADHHAHTSREARLDVHHLQANAAMHARDITSSQLTTSPPSPPQAHAEGWDGSSAVYVNHAVGRKAPRNKDLKKPLDNKNKADDRFAASNTNSTHRPPSFQGASTQEHSHSLSEWQPRCEAAAERSAARRDHYRDERGSSPTTEARQAHTEALPSTHTHDSDIERELNLLSSVNQLTHSKRSKGGHMHTSAIDAANASDRGFGVQSSQRSGASQREMELDQGLTDEFIPKSAGGGPHSRKQRGGGGGHDQRPPRNRGRQEQFFPHQRGGGEGQEEHPPPPQAERQEQEYTPPPYQRRDHLLPYQKRGQPPPHHRGNQEASPPIFHPSSAYENGYNEDCEGGMMGIAKGKTVETLASDREAAPPPHPEYMVKARGFQNIRRLQQKFLNDESSQKDGRGVVSRGGGSGGGSSGGALDITSTTQKKGGGGHHKPLPPISETLVGDEEAEEGSTYHPYTSVDARGPSSSSHSGGHSKYEANSFYDVATSWFFPLIEVPSTLEQCGVCFVEMSSYVSVCHRCRQTLCWLCCVRLRRLSNDRRCPYCLTDMPAVFLTFAGSLKLLQDEKKKSFFTEENCKLLATAAMSVKSLKEETSQVMYLAALKNPRYLGIVKGSIPPSDVDLLEHTLTLVRDAEIDLRLYDVECGLYFEDYIVKFACLFLSMPICWFPQCRNRWLRRVFAWFYEENAQHFNLQKMHSQFIYTSLEPYLRHLKDAHCRHVCETCLSSYKLKFLCEQFLYSWSSLDHHIKYGEPQAVPVIHPHPLCPVCEERLLDFDTLTVHCIKDHHVCEICMKKPTSRKDGRSNNLRGIVFKDYDSMMEHNRANHYVCPFGCDFLSFATDNDLQFHIASEHASEAKSSKVKIMPQRHGASLNRHPQRSQGVGGGGMNFLSSTHSRQVGGGKNSASSGGGFGASSTPFATQSGQNASLAILDSRSSSGGAQQSSSTSSGGVMGGGGGNLPMDAVLSNAERHLAFLKAFKETTMELRSDITNSQAPTVLVTKLKAKIEQHSQKDLSTLRGLTRDLGEFIPPKLLEECQALVPEYFRRYKDVSGTSSGDKDWRDRMEFYLEKLSDKELLILFVYINEVEVAVKGLISLDDFPLLPAGKKEAYPSLPQVMKGGLDKGSRGPAAMHSRNWKVGKSRGQMRDDDFPSLPQHEVGVSAGSSSFKGIDTKDPPLPGTSAQHTRAAGLFADSKKPPNLSSSSSSSAFNVRNEAKIPVSKASNRSKALEDGEFPPFGMPWRSQVGSNEVSSNTQSAALWSTFRESPKPSAEKKAKSSVKNGEDSGMGGTTRCGQCKYENPNTKTRCMLCDATLARYKPIDD